MCLRKIFDKTITCNNIEADNVPDGLVVLSEEVRKQNVTCVPWFLIAVFGQGSNRKVLRKEPRSLQVEMERNRKNPEILVLDSLKGATVFYLQLVRNKEKLRNALNNKG